MSQELIALAWLRTTVVLEPRDPTHEHIGPSEGSLDRRRQPTAEQKASILWKLSAIDLMCEYLVFGIEKQIVVTSEVESTGLKVSVTSSGPRYPRN